MRDRFCPVLYPDFVCCKAPFSFYRFIERYWPGNEENRTLHRTFSLMRKMNVRSVAVEDLARKGELEAEAAAVEARCQGPVEFLAWRFSFFAVPITQDTLAYAGDADCLGYAILVSLKLPQGSFCRYIYESVIVEPSFHGDGHPHVGIGLPSHYVHCLRRYSTWVAGRRFTVLGSFFCQQNGVTHVCAHAAIRWVLNNLPERTDQILSYEDINRDLGIDHVTRKVGQCGDDAQPVGLPLDDLLKVVRLRNYRYVRAEYESPRGTPQPYWRFVYSIIESGYPVLVFFQTEHARHVICVIGHTFNSDIWDGEARLAYSRASRAEYISTASWADHFIIHDDNYGMYFCMPSKALLPPGDEHQPFQVTGAMGIVPDNVDLGPLEAESLASMVLRLTLTVDTLHDCYWLKALREEENAVGKWVVLRTFLASKAIYQQHLRSIEDLDGEAMKEDELTSILQSYTPDHFWMIEITLADVYTANKRKLGEILFRLSDPRILREDSLEIFTKKLFSACIAIRLPGNIITPTVGQKRVLLNIRATTLAQEQANTARHGAWRRRWCMSAYSPCLRRSAA